MRHLYADKSMELLRDQAEEVLKLAQMVHVFFEALPPYSIQEATKIRETATRAYSLMKEAAQKNGDKNSLYLTSCLHRIGEEIFQSLLEVSEFKMTPPAEIALMAKYLEQALKSISDSLALYPGNSCLPHLIAIKKYAYEINQIYKKARLDSFKDPHTVNGLKRSEISLRFSEAGELTHKIADSLGEVITA